MVDKDGNPVVDDQGQAVMFNSGTIFNNDTLVRFDAFDTAHSGFHLPSPLQMAANHVCAYECYLTAEFCQSDVSKSSSCDCKDAI